MAAKKKPGPKKGKKVPPKAPIEVKVEVPLTVKPLDPVASGPKQTPERMKLRLEAQAVYLQDMTGCTVEDVHKDPRFKDIPLTTLKRWAHEDGWAEARKIAYQNLQKRLTQEASSRLTDRLYFEVVNLLDMKEQAAILRKKTEAKSWEGVAKIEMEINARLLELQQMAAQGLIDDVGKAIEQKAGTVPTVQYDKAYLKGIARMFTEQKRKELRERIAMKGLAAGGEPVVEVLPPEETTKHEPEEAEVTLDFGDAPVPELGVVPQMGKHSVGHSGDGA